MKNKMTVKQHIVFMALAFAMLFLAYVNINKKRYKPQEEELKEELESAQNIQSILKQQTVPALKDLSVLRAEITKLKREQEGFFDEDDKDQKTKKKAKVLIESVATRNRFLAEIYQASHGKVHIHENKNKVAETRKIRGKEIKTFTYTFSASGSLNSFYNFLKIVEAKPYLTQTESLSIEGKEKGYLPSLTWKVTF